MIGVPDTTSILFENIKAFFFNVLWAAVKIALDKGQGVVGFIAQVGVLCIPAKLTIYMYSKVFCRGDNTKEGTMDVVLYLDRVEFFGNSQNLTFVGVEFHFISALPCLEGID